MCSSFYLPIFNIITYFLPTAMVGTGVSRALCDKMYFFRTSSVTLGPILMTVGPWKPITLQTYQNRITDVEIRNEVSEALDVKLSATLAFSEKAPGFASFTLLNPDGTVEASSNKISVGSGRAKVDFEWKAGQLQLWYPVGYGSQPLYTVEVKLLNEVYISIFCTDVKSQLTCAYRTEKHSTSRPIGLRSGALGSSKRS